MDLKTTVGLPHLIIVIQKRIIALPHVGDELPRTWVEVRRALENDPRPYIPLTDYLRICQENGIARLEDQLQLSGYLHDLGVCLHFQDHDTLKHTVILKPEWATAAVYRILDNEQVNNNQGHFSRTDLEAIWHEEEYALLRGDLLALMMRFQLCYEIPGQQGYYIAPQLLSQRPPTYDWPESGNLLLCYRAPDFMPKGIIARFIVAMHKHIEAQRVWRDGVVLALGGARAEVIEFYGKREIQLRITGANQGDLLRAVTWELDKIFNSFHKLNYDKWVPCSCTECCNNQNPYFYAMDSLKRRLAHNINQVQCDRSYKTVSIYNLIENTTGSNEQLGRWLYAMLVKKFDLEKIRQLCFELEPPVDFEDLRGETKSAKARELLAYMWRHGRLDELERQMGRKRGGREG